MMDEKMLAVHGLALENAATAVNAFIDAVVDDYSADHHEDDCPGECDEHAVVVLLNAAHLATKAGRTSGAALVAEVRHLREALVLAEEAMNHMGDALNEMDAVLPEDETKVAPAFVAVRKALGIVIPGMPE